ncbi:MAG: DUF3060 domain-containing protein [Dokdonella sp.]|uniref:DUF3060 domain-containing protein n=1 Tax=Dokdonella sp. TaxID=2291710 RepID=UPI00326754AF
MHKPMTGPSRHLLAVSIVATVSFIGCAVAEETPLIVNSKSATIDCAHRDVNVVSSGAKLVFTGECNKLYFIGGETDATVESATMVQVSGNGVVITARKIGDVALIGSGTQLTSDAVDDLSLTGDSAIVKAKSLKNVSAVGQDNQVSWSTGSPRINDIGSNNTLKPVR